MKDPHEETWQELSVGLGGFFKTAAYILLGSASTLLIAYILIKSGVFS